MDFPLDVSAYKPLTLDPAQPKLTAEQRQQWITNIQVMRDTIIFMSAVADAKGLGGHTGGPYDIVPEFLLADGFMRGGSVYPVPFDESGHRVAIQYAIAAFNGEMPMEKLLHYREAGFGLYGHPERDESIGVKFSSGRLGHMWAFCNGVAMANPDKAVVVFGSDGAQMEGDDAEAARTAVAKNINIKLLIDDNNVTIAGHPKEYMPGYDVAKTLGGQGLTVDAGEGEDFDTLYERFHKALNTPGPVALVNRRIMAPGIPEVEGKPGAHDVVSVANATKYFEARGMTHLIDFLKGIEKTKSSATYLGSTKEIERNRSNFGKYVNGVLAKMTPEDRKARVLVIDSDLEGSTGLKDIHKEYPEIFFNGGVMERGNYSAAAGFGFEKGKQGIFATFSAFSEMILSEATMARLNEANILCHFSHAGVDEMADNTCHFGINIMFVDNGLPELDHTRLYFPSDPLQFKAAIETIFFDPGLRYIFSTRSGTPFILKEDGTKYFDPANGYKFVPGKDEVIREGSAGYVVSYGEMLYRALDAVERARQQGIDVGLINKSTLNVVDEDMMEKIGETGFVIVAESQNRTTGLGSRFGSWLLERGFGPRYSVMATTKQGEGGLAEHIPHQGLDPESILNRIVELSSTGCGCGCCCE
ncbi:MAG: transketolase C-terminal domain-containing protein [FCB group bacterium]|jgi:transketolase C-terminal domain/subunit|nr:transketolase C-terminal domain-containing protein [FCB group bacterium]